MSSAIRTDGRAHMASARNFVFRLEKKYLKIKYATIHFYQTTIIIITIIFQVFFRILPNDE